ncbi:DUF4082 domain-containing protein [Nonomuraea rhodomycinica]|uniref:DUF4082 domain-containing protein n=1 Tax=Nonomuraea rhodomycinica TaxID=1712872 RepID=A0A7Y6MBK0_9ACTN|nr:DUF4082 domain-containing protein [Nonomuraea rhodomycinica]NUW42408.1 DUF4082 domain-containing protein [Nonomuraea rhodomycinica]
MPDRAVAAPLIPLGNAAGFAVLAGGAVVNTDNTTVTGDLGTSPGTVVSGFPPGQVIGTVHAGDATAASARTDAVAAYNNAAGRGVTDNAPAQLGGTTKEPGVYVPSSGTTFQITGTLTLDAKTDPNAIFIFRAATLTTATVSNINLVNGARTDNVFFQITGTATLGVDSTFRGNVLANNAATVSSGAAVTGRVFALTNNVTLQGTTSGPRTRVSLPEELASHTSLTVSPSGSAAEGQQVTLSAEVGPQSGTVIPQGKVAFKDGTTLLGTDFVDENGDAQLQTTTLPGGNHRLTAVFLGGETFDGEALVYFAPSTSSGVNLTVTESLWSNSATPAVANQPDNDPITLGVRFASSTSGLVRGIRFYKGSQNTGTHVGSLWTTGGTQLASVTFSGESASGWQEADFSTPVPINAGTVYIASYFTSSGHFSYTQNYFTTERDSPPLTAPASAPGARNGVYTLGAANAFPTSTFQATNYWVDPVFVRSDTVWTDAAKPAVLNDPDTDPVTLGMKFRADTAGVVRGIRFYKGAQNTGTHVGTLWTAGGTQLASVTFSGESASGWQQAYFSSPVSVSADTTYIASYFTSSGHFSYTLQDFFDAQRNYPLTALENGGVSGANGVYAYGASNTFPTNPYQATNYWVDVLFDIS